MVGEHAAEMRGVRGVPGRDGLAGEVPHEQASHNMKGSWKQALASMGSYRDFK